MLRLTTLPATAALAVVAAFGCSPAEQDAPTYQPTFTLTPQESGTDALLQAISFGAGGVVWVSGHQATWGRSIDLGETWSMGTVPGAEGLQFRDVAAIGSAGAYLMSAGTGEQSRIYRTDDLGETWTLQYTADHPDAFLDCMDFWSPERGLVYGDEVDGVPFILSTEDGGETWSRVAAEGLPSALEGEGGFAASGTCLETQPEGRAWIATGNAERARVLRTEDYGVTWTATDVPVPGGTAAGLTTVRMGRDGAGIAMGGVIGQDSIRTDNMVVTTDAGASWSLAKAPSFDGPVYGAALVSGGPDHHVIAVGPRGLAWSTDFGQTWVTVDTTTYWAVSSMNTNDGWAVGPRGRIVHLEIGSVGALEPGSE